MDLRYFVLTLTCAFAALRVIAAPTKSYPLDDRSVYTVRLSREEPTTCVFPGALKAIVGANVSTRIEDNPAVLLSHEAGAEYFSLRALKENASGALNILFRGRVYALGFTSAAEADRSVVFLDEPLNGGATKKLSTETLRALIERARQHIDVRIQTAALGGHHRRAGVVLGRDQLDVFFLAAVLELDGIPHFGVDAVDGLGTIEHGETPWSAFGLQLRDRVAGGCPGARQTRRKAVRERPPKAPRSPVVLYLIASRSVPDRLAVRETASDFIESASRAASPRRAPSGAGTACRG